jgi:hypothetical protein
MSLAACVLQNPDTLFHLFLLMDKILVGLSANDLESQFFEAGGDGFIMKVRSNRKVLGNGRHERSNIVVLMTFLEYLLYEQPFPCKPDPLKKELLRVIAAKEQKWHERNAVFAAF